MKIALVAPPIKSRYVQGLDEPLGLEYLAAVVEHAHDVCIIDAFNQRLTVEDTIMLLEEYEPDVVGLGLVMTGAHDPTLEICRAVKARFPRAVTVLGGHTAMFVADDLVVREEVDCIVWAEGEPTFVDLVEHIERGRDWRAIQGIIYSDGAKVVRTEKRSNIEDLNAHPLPARHLLPGIEDYMLSVLRSRGCAYYCPYCSVAAFWGGRMNRRRSDESVLAELAHISEHYPRDTVAFADDTFTVPPKQVLELCAKIGGANLGLTWSCTGRVETITPELLDGMRAAGCTDMFFGIESGSDKVLRRLGRRYDANRVLEIYEMCLLADIRPRFSFIFGLPDEDWDAVQDTWRLIERLEGVSVGVHILTPLPGTDIGTDPESFGIKVTTEHGVGDLDINSDVMIENGFLSKEQIREAYRRGAGLAVRAGRRSVAVKRILAGERVPPLGPPRLRDVDRAPAAQVSADPGVVTLGTLRASAKRQRTPATSDG
ncbi:MAG: B12-binding domain-containing radical SAM protein [Deltaproteobacteria bacterium]|nr:B12-binding domain-containing radical SAM protein [Deltaproteobacteria bacterium]